MKLELKIYNALCSTELFRINGIDASELDFGNKEDIDAENAEDYCCSNMTFEGQLHPAKDILEKYKINESEYSEVIFALTEGLSFGDCGWCS